MVCIALLAGNAFAVPVWQPSGANLTYGDVTHGRATLSSSGNPAAAASGLETNGGKGTSGTYVSLNGGIEYGNIDELFETIDALALAFKPSDPGDGGDAPGQEPDDKPDDGINIGDIIDDRWPDADEFINELTRQAVFVGAKLALIKTEGYGKLFVNADVPIVVGKEFLGGAWTFDIGVAGISKAFGVSRPLNYDSALAAQRVADWFQEAIPPRKETRTISGSVQMVVDPEDDEISYLLDNDSSLITKSASILEVTGGYSRRIWPTEHGSLYAGVEASFYRVGLSRLSVRFGDITDSDELLESIRDSERDYSNGLGADIGLLWLSDRYLLGATLANVNEPKFEYPDVDVTPYRDPFMLEFLRQDRLFKMGRQIKFEAAAFSADRRWSLNFGVDANAIEDPVRDKYQWITMSTGYETDSWWLPGVRVGFRRNMAGTQKTYLALGATVLKIVNIDVASSLQTTKIDGTDLPEGIMLSIGFDLQF